MLKISKLWGKVNGEATAIYGIECLAADICGTLGIIYGSVCPETRAGSAGALGRKRAADAELR